MLKRIILALVGAVLFSLTIVGPAHAYTPQPGAAFNDPSGDRAAQSRLAVRVRESIKSVPRHGIIRIATYSFDRADITDALLAACRRKVTVQVVLNDNWVSGPVRRLRRQLGSHIDPRYADACHRRQKPEDPATSDVTPYEEPSFVKICENACRGGFGNQHMKFFLFSQAGLAENVLMTGSVNLTEYAASTHWNDMFTVVGQQDVFDDYSSMFRELAEDQPVRARYRVHTHGDLVTEFGARRGTKWDNDPVMERLDQVACRTSGGFGSDRRTVIKISMYAWGGDRGEYLARKVGGLRRDGCDVRAILSGPSVNVKTILRRNGVSLRTASMNLDGDAETGFGTTAWERFTHEKWMALDGTWGGVAQKVVWTGSENWSDRSRANDEVTLKIPRAGAHTSYSRHFNHLWNHKTRGI